MTHKHSKLTPPKPPSPKKADAAKKFSPAPAGRKTKNVNQSPKTTSTHPAQERSSADKYMYLWAVALIAFGIGLLTGYGVAANRYAPQLVDKYYLSTPVNNAVELNHLKNQNIANQANKTPVNLQPIIVPAPDSNTATETAPTQQAPAPPSDNAANLAKADAWLTSHGLNEYGDPQGTSYTGGSPLFDESTGAATDRYLYLQNKFPDEPWLK